MLRVLRILSVSDQLRGFLSSTRRTLGILWRSALVCLVLAYIFAMSGFYFFGETDPGRWGTLVQAVASVLVLAVLDDVRGALDAAMQTGAGAFIFFLLFYGVWGAFALNVLGAVVASHVAHNRAGENV